MAPEKGGDGEVAGEIKICYNPQVASGGGAPSSPKKLTVTDILNGVIKGDIEIGVYEPDDFVYQISKPNKTGRLITGMFMRFSKAGWPLLGKIGTQEEREIDAKQNEALLDKNHFLLDTSRDVILYQATAASNYPRLAEYLGHISGDQVKFAPIPTIKSITNMLENGELSIKEFNVKIPRPLNIDSMPSSHNARWDNFGLHEFFGANFITLKAHGIAKAEGMQGRNWLSKLLNTDMEQITGKIHFRDEDGNPSIVDMIYDRLIHEVQVPMNGRYPLSDALFTEMKKLLIDAKPDLDAFSRGND